MSTNTVRGELTRTIHLERTTPLAAPAVVVWRHATSMDGVSAELAPLVRMTHPADATSLEGVEVPLGQVAFRSWLLAFGFLPFDLHSLRLVEVDERGEDGGSFVEESSSWMQRRWRHERTVTPTADGGCVVTDRLTVEPRLPVSVLVAPVVARVFDLRHRRLLERFGRGR